MPLFGSLFHHSLKKEKPQDVVLPSKKDLVEPQPRIAKSALTTQNEVKTGKILDATSQKVQIKNYTHVESSFTADRRRSSGSEAFLENKYEFTNGVVPNGDFGFRSRVYLVFQRPNVTIASKRPEVTRSFLKSLRMTGDEHEILTKIQAVVGSHDALSSTSASAKEEGSYTGKKKPFAAKLFLRAQEQIRPGHSAPSSFQPESKHLEGILREYGIGSLFTLLKQRYENVPVTVHNPFRHPSAHFVSVVELIQSQRDKNWYQIMQYYANGDLCSVVDTHLKSKMPMSTERLYHWWRQIVDAVNWMHINGVAHGDLKPDNFLIDHDGETLLLSDFGMSQFHSHASRDVVTGDSIGTAAYMAPELFLRFASRTTPKGTALQYNPFAVDVWACGVIFCVLKNMRQPWPKAVANDVRYKAFLRGEHDPSINWLPEEREVVMRRMLNPEARNRPSLKEVTQSPLYYHMVQTILARHTKTN